MQEKQFLNAAELARILGVTKVTVLQMIKRGDVPARKIGRKWFISAEWLNGVK